MPDPNIDVKGKALKRLLDMSKQEKKEYDEQSDELDQFAYNTKHTFTMEGDSITFGSRISKVSQAIELMGAHLDDPTPQRVVTPRKRANDLIIQRCKVEEDLLNYLVDETGLVAQTRMARSQAIAHGCGVVWTGWNPDRKLPQTVYDSDENLFQDPFARNPLQRKMCFRKREKPRWEVAEAYGTDERTKLIVTDMKAVEGTSEDRKTDVVCYYEAYFTTGLHNYVTEGMASVDAEGNDIQPDNNPVKYVFTDDGKLLSEGTWEIAWFKDGKWPYTLLGFRDKPETLWHPSVLSTGIGHIKALNFLYTYFLKRYRFATRLVLGVADINGKGLDAEAKGDVLNILNDSAVATLTLDGMNDGKKFGDFVQELNLETRVGDFVQAFEIVEKQFEQETGLYEFLHYGAGDTQDRTAAATQARQSATKTRIEDMRVHHTDWQSAIARQEAQAARFLLNSQEVSVILSPEDAQVWGDIAPPEMVAQQEQQNQMVAQVSQQAAQMGVPPPMGLPPPRMLIDYEKWLREADHSVEASYARRKDLEARIDSLQELNNQVNPQLLQSPDPNERALAFDNMAMLFDARGVPDELVAKYRAQGDTLRQMAIQQQMMAQQQAAMGMQPGAPIPGPGSQQAPPQAQGAAQ